VQMAAEAERRQRAAEGHGISLVEGHGQHGDSDPPANPDHGR
jgi:hypothetical protein